MIDYVIICIIAFIIYISSFKGKNISCKNCKSCDSQYRRINKN